MIHPNELRHNSWYLLNDKPVRYDITSLVVWDLDTYSPIKITSELLEKAGFELERYTMTHDDPPRSADHIRGDLWVNDDTLIIYDFSTPCTHKDYQQGYEEFYVSSKSDLYDGSPVPVKYLHQLQNLFFALSGEELQIEL